MKNPLRIAVPALISMLLAPAAGLHASEPEGETPSLTVGRRVRFIAPGVAPGRVVGWILAEDDETLTVKVKGGRLRIRRDAIASLDASKRTSRWKKGALVGGGIGLGLYGLAAVQLDARGGEHAAVLVPFGAALGMLTGAAVGACIEDDHWHPVSPERLRVNVGPVPGRGVGASVAIRF